MVHSQSSGRDARQWWICNDSETDFSPMQPLRRQSEKWKIQAIAVMSGCGECGLVDPYAMQDYCDLACQGDLCPFRTSPFGDVHPRALEFREPVMRANRTLAAS
jgi:hypothetical protein